jgi:hypothetical protein
MESFLREIFNCNNHVLPSSTKYLPVVDIHTNEVVKSHNRKASGTSLKRAGKTTARPPAGKNFSFFQGKFSQGNIYLWWIFITMKLL